MKLKINLFSALFIIAFVLFSSCKNVKIEDDYYYTESEAIDDMIITLKGKGYGVYGQMIAKYKSGSIKELMKGEPMKIRSSSSDDNNSTYNEIYLTFEKNGYIKSFETDVSASKPEGICQVKVYYTDSDDKEYSLTSSTYLSGVVNINKEVKAVVLYIKAFKFYPTSYSSLVFKNDLTSDDFEEMKGKQVNNEISINYVKIEE